MQLVYRLRAVLGLEPYRKYSRIEFSVGKMNTVRFFYTDTHQSRQEATMHLVLEALKTIKYEVTRINRRLVLITGDQPPDGASEPIMSYATRNETPNVVAVPDFVFWNWPDVGIMDYTELTESMIAAGAIPPTDDRLFWIGNPEMHPIRKRLRDIAREDTRILATGVRWVKQGRPEGWSSDTLMSTAESNYVSLPDHCRYKYLIDLEGIGYSARLKVLLFSGRPVFIQERPWREFFFDRLEPYGHFIPVKRDLSDLSSQLDWAEANPDKCKDIAARAQSLAKEHLTRHAAIAYFRRTILSILS